MRIACAKVGNEEGISRRSGIFLMFNENCISIKKAVAFVTR